MPSPRSADPGTVPQATAHGRVTAHHLRSVHPVDFTTGTHYGVGVEVMAAMDAAHQAHDGLRPDGSCLPWPSSMIHGLSAAGSWLASRRSQATLLDLIEAWAIQTEGQVHIGLAVQQFSNAVRQPQEDLPQWETSRDWAREFIAYVDSGAASLAAMYIEQRVPLACLPHLQFVSWERWHATVRAALAAGVAPEAVAGHLGEDAFRSLAPDTIVAWHHRFGPARARLLARAGITPAEADRCRVDDATLAAMAALREPT